MCVSVCVRACVCVHACVCVCACVRSQKLISYEDKVSSVPSLKFASGTTIFSMTTTSSIHNIVHVRVYCEFTVYCLVLYLE